MYVQRNQSLKKLNTFGIDIKAKYFFKADDIDDLKNILLSPAFKKMPKLILGGGSNVLFTKDFDGLVLKNNFKGMRFIREDEQFVWVEIQGGEEWHDFVLFCLEHNWAGAENLSLIPGSVGAAPMQNIGAYGIEIESIFDHLLAIHLETGQLRSFTKEECQFAYRSSIFKTSLKGQYFILNVTFKLNKQPNFKVSYGAIQKVLAERSYENNLNIQKVSEVICDIRKSKLPDPKVLGNSGSFFKNPIIEKKLFENIQSQYEQAPSYPAGDGFVKVPAAWLIEQCGWKGKKIGQTGTYKNHALVLVNHGGATGQEIFDLAQKIQTGQMRGGCDVAEGIAPPGQPVAFLQEGRQIG